jgi:hypothetical protein
MEKPTFSRACLSDVSVIMAIMCSFCGVAMSGGDGMDSSTRVSAARRAWVHVVMSCLSRHLMPSFSECPTLVVLA